MSESLFGQRAAGVLLHLSSLPSPYGAGDLGHAAYRFVEFLAAAGARVWQMLPLAPTTSRFRGFEFMVAFDEVMVGSSQERQ